jgi:hypothetical protein
VFRANALTQLPTVPLEHLSWPRGLVTVRPPAGVGETGLGAIGVLVAYLWQLDGKGHGHAAYT